MKVWPGPQEMNLKYGKTSYRENLKTGFLLYWHRNVERAMIKECEKCGTGINCMYSICVEYLEKWTKPMEDSSFHMDDTK
jgi:hypothetical protein